MKFILKFAVKTVLNGVVLYLLHSYLAGFIVRGDYVSLLIGGAVLAFIGMVVRPIVRLVTAPIVWLTLGLFNLVINVGLLYVADQILPQVEIHGYLTLLLASIIISLVNSLF
ncbi:MAG: phage holin family protein [Candidatus Sungbacteria bacterium]|nr:phage holin family protein [Candidatus Sungbacteria bacterium]